MKKYELTNETEIDCGRTLYRIKALRDFSDVKAGNLGGFVESEDNLSHEGNAWISENAYVYENALVYGDAYVYENARVFGDVEVYGNAYVFGNAEVFGNARVSGNAKVYGDALVYGNARVHGNALVYENARVYGNALVYENARVSGNAKVYGNAEATTLVQNTITHKHNITMTDTHIAIGCENHTIEHWKKNIDKIGKKHEYSEKEIKAVRKLLTGLLMIREGK